MRIGLDDRRRLLEVARGERPADLFVRGGTVANVYSGELLPESNVAISGGHIAYVGRGEQSVGSGTRILDATGKIVSPGYVEAHSHPWVLYNPVSLAEGVLPLGTTTIVADNLFFYMQMGPEGFMAMADDLCDLPLLYLWVARLTSQASFRGEAEMFALDRLQSLLERDDVVGTAEVTRWPALAAGDEGLLSGISAAHTLGKFADGHTGGASEARLAEAVVSGIDADHEAITAEEVLGRLRLGLWTMLRHSSLRPDLPELLRAVTEGGASTHRLVMTTDGPAPQHIAEQGFVDGLLRVAVENGVPPMQALQMATINPATLLRLDDSLGGIAPGRRADLLLLPDLVSFLPKVVVARGEVVAESGELLAPLPALDWDRYGSRPSFGGATDLGNPGLYTLRELASPDEPPIIHLRSAAITCARRDGRSRMGRMDPENQPRVLYAALVDRGGEWISRALVSGFARGLDGLASTYNTTTHMLVLGRLPEAMARAAGRVRELGGGIVIARGEEFIYELPLPIAGMMSELAFPEVVRGSRRLSRVVAEAGYEYHDILYTLLFLTCDFLPSLRLTPLGLLDVKARKPVVPSEEPRT